MRMPVLNAVRCVGLALLMVASLAGCAPSPAPAEGPTAPLEFDARVVHVPLEGGFYGLIATDDVRYEPLELAPHLRREGLQLHVTAEPANVASIRMWGRPIRILHAEPLQ